MMALGQGCTVTTTTGDFVDQYERCNASTDDCAAGFSCQNANTMVAGASGPGAFCTSSCSSSSQCPASADLLEGVCVVSNGTGQCYTACVAGSLACPSGETCVEVAGMMPYCVPGSGGGPVVTFAVYDTCSSGTDPCASGTTCVEANTMVAGQSAPGALCSLASGCTSSDDCPTAPTGLEGVCVIANSSGVCYSACAAGSLACPTGQTCVESAGMMPYCVPNGT